ncbi:MAG: hypothetical protein AVDCRST_MAG49-899 [uncultured Thermomicrobiales bacterium]|uniref:Uncharacterized protein n=1 Tax=uncultured Thermomicrobiales bacterium TaxID=1645740 RepID=A0A6J4U5V9_9BACT|nr:MAG: hypothetical protein AVDCRST_MAG49-899 [uncultured Thermomicrobiales bacterium]
MSPRRRLSRPGAAGPPRGLRAVTTVGRRDGPGRRSSPLGAQPP